MAHASAAIGRLLSTVRELIQARGWGGSRYRFGLCFGGDKADSFPSREDDDALPRGRGDIGSDCQRFVDRILGAGELFRNWSKRLKSGNGTCTHGAPAVSETTGAVGRARSSAEAKLRVLSITASALVR